MDRMGRGYSFEALRAKILFTEGAQFKKTKQSPKFARRSSDYAEVGFNKMHMDDLLVRFKWSDYDNENQHESEPEVVNYGASISTLIQLIEEGKL